MTANSTVTLFTDETEPAPSEHELRVVGRGRELWNHNARALLGLSCVLAAIGIGGFAAASRSTWAVVSDLVVTAATASGAVIILGRQRGPRARFGTLLLFVATASAIVLGTGADGSSRALAVAAVGVLGTCCATLGLVSSAARDARAAARERVLHAVPNPPNNPFHMLVESLADVVAVVDGDLTIRYVSSSIRAAFGHDPSALIGERLERLSGAGAGPLLEAFRRAAMQHGHGIRVEWELLDSGGRRRAVESTVSSRLNDPQLCAFVLTTRDVSERVALEHQLRKHAFQDSLTGLANRALLLDRAHRALARSRARSHAIGLVVFDIDQFREMNTALGRPAGDYMLSVIAQRIARAVESHHTASRHGGDEFALLVEELADEAELRAFVGPLAEQLRAPITFGDEDYVLSVSVGASMSNEATTVESLFDEADTALFVAKREGGNTERHFKPSMRVEAMERFDLEAELRRALERSEFELLYQPTFDIASGKIASFEALLRWRRPGVGLVSPEEFVTHAEERGLMVDIGRWVLRTALEQLVELATQGEDELAVSVNISPSQLADSGFVEDVRVALAASGITPSQLILEITESAFQERSGLIVRQLHKLRELGVRLAVDDFGTGYATLSFLERLPIDILKIDQSFVQAGVDERGRGVLEAIVRLGQTLSLVTVAEGAEEPNQLEVLIGLGCTMVQGFLLSRPISATEAARLVGHRSDDEASVAPILGWWLQRHVVGETQRALS